MTLKLIPEDKIVMTINKEHISLTTANGFPVIEWPISDLSRYPDRVEAIMKQCREIVDLDTAVEHLVLVGYLDYMKDVIRRFQLSCNEEPTLWGIFSRCVKYLAITDVLFEDKHELTDPTQFPSSTDMFNYVALLMEPYVNALTVDNSYNQYVFNLAEKIHTVTCHSNHADACDYYYEHEFDPNWRNGKSERSRYCRMAHEILESLGGFYSDTIDIYERMQVIINPRYDVQFKAIDEKYPILDGDD